MSDKLIKQPIRIIFWLVIASGVAVVLGEQAGYPPGGKLALVSRTAFWCAAIAYFAVRVYQVVVSRTGRKENADETEN